MGAVTVVSVGEAWESDGLLGGVGVSEVSFEVLAGGALVAVWEQAGGQLQAETPNS